MNTQAMRHLLFCNRLTLLVSLQPVCMNTAAGYEVRHPHDSSIQTYRGHKVLQTLIRAYFR
jgi:hypothetical protein